jgi:hypothetical protein
MAAEAQAVISCAWKPTVSFHGQRRGRLGLKQTKSKPSAPPARLIATLST